VWVGWAYNIYLSYICIYTYRERGREYIFEDIYYILLNVLIVTNTIIELCKENEAYIRDISPPDPYSPEKKMFFWKPTRALGVLER
jgi:hypothetical protein